MMGFGNGLDFGSGGVLWAVGCIALVVGLVALIAWAVSRATTHNHGTKPPQRSEALEILRSRFARGEISDAEYTLAANALGTDR